MELQRFATDYRNRSAVVPCHKSTRPPGKEKNKFILEKKMFEEDRQAQEAREASKIKNEESHLDKENGEVVEVKPVVKQEMIELPCLSLLPPFTPNTPSESLFDRLNDDNVDHLFFRKVGVATASILE